MIRIEIKGGADSGKGVYAEKIKVFLNLLGLYDVEIYEDGLQYVYGKGDAPKVLSMDALINPEAIYEVEKGIGLKVYEETLNKRIPFDGFFDGFKDSVDIFIVNAKTAEKAKVEAKAALSKKMDSIRALVSLIDKESSNESLEVDAKVTAQAEKDGEFKSFITSIKSGISIDLENYYNRLLEDKSQDIKCHVMLLTEFMDTLIKDASKAVSKHLGIYKDAAQAVVSIEDRGWQLNALLNRQKYSSCKVSVYAPSQYTTF